MTKKILKQARVQQQQLEDEVEEKNADDGGDFQGSKKKVKSNPVKLGDGDSDEDEDEFKAVSGDEEDEQDDFAKEIVGGFVFRIGGSGKRCLTSM